MNVFFFEFDDFFIWYGLQELKIGLIHAQLGFFFSLFFAFQKLLDIRSPLPVIEN